MMDFLLLFVVVVVVVVRGVVVQKRNVEIIESDFYFEARDGAH